MSEIKVNSIKGVGASTAAITIDNSSGACTANITNNLSNRRLNINGAFQVMQRGTQSSVTTGKYGVDRWKFEVYNCGTWTLSQDTDVPSGKGFSKSYKIQCTTADASPAATDYLETRYRFEGLDLQMLQWGTSDAKPLTVSFWIKCKKTGTFNLNLLANGAANKSLGKVITISAADTWEYKSVTFSGDTAQAIISDSAARLTLIFWLDAGSTYKGGTSPTSAWETLTSANRAASTTIALADNTANYVNLCGVQIEAGSVATEFEHKSYGQELALAQRYYERIDHISGAAAFAGGLAGFYNASEDIVIIHHFRVVKRATTTFEYSALSDLDFEPHDNSVSGLALSIADTKCIVLRTTSTTAETKGHACYLCIDQANGFIAFNAEL